MSTQLRLGPIPELNDMHPFIDAVMDQVLKIDFIALDL